MAVDIDQLPSTQILVTAIKGQPTTRTTYQIQIINQLKLQTITKYNKISSNNNNNRNFTTLIITANHFPSHHVLVTF